MFIQEHFNINKVMCGDASLLCVNEKQLNQKPNKIISPMNGFTPE